MSAPPKTFKESVLELNRNAKTWDEVESFITSEAKKMKKSVKVLMGRFEKWLKEANEEKAPTAEEIEQMENILGATYKPKKSMMAKALEGFEKDAEEITSPIPEEKIREVAQLHEENNLDAPSGCPPHTGKMPKIKMQKSDDKGVTWYEPKTKFDIKNLNGKCLCGCEYTPAEGNLFYRGHGRKLKMAYLKYLKAQKVVLSLPPETQSYLSTRWSGLTV